MTKPVTSSATVAASAALAKLFAQALALHQQGQLAPARRCYEQILRIAPRHFDALHLSGVLAAQRRDFERAGELIRKALEIKPDFAQAHYNLGNVLKDLGRLEPARSSYQRAVACQADFAEAHCALGNVLAQLERTEAARKHFSRAIELRGRYAEAYAGRAAVLHRLSQPQAALIDYDRAIELRPDYAEAYCNRGNLFMESGQPQAALADFESSLALKPGDAEAHCNRGEALRQLGRLEAAVASHDQAIAIRPDFAGAHCNRGVVCYDMKRLDDAIACYDRAIALSPDYAEAHCNRAFALLLAGDFERGWREYEWRWGPSQPMRASQGRNPARPLWHEEPLTGKTILLRGEQGFGDAIQFCRYATPVAAMGARVVLEVEAPLTRLLATARGVSAVIARGTEPPALDYHCALMSLPQRLHTRLDTIPQPSPYLHAGREDVERWSARLDAALGKPAAPRVGLVWSGRQTHGNDRRRSIPLAQLLEALPRGLRYVSLQAQVRDGDHRSLAASGSIVDITDGVRDFADTAALCECLDLVVAVDTSVAHLSAALGKRTWILLPFAPDWRWLLDRDDSPWYPTARLYRQERIDDWGGALARLGADLAREFG